MGSSQIRKTASHDRTSGGSTMRPSPCSTATLALWWCFLLVARLTSSGARAAGWGAWGNLGRIGQRGDVPSNDDGPSDADFEKVIRQLELDQLAAEAERVGFEVLEEEAEEKKRTQILANVAKACSTGAQMTLVMGGGALLFRLLPVLFGSDLEDDEEAEANSPYLLQDNGRPQALPAAARRRLLTDGSKDPAEEARGEGGKGEKDGAVVAVAKEGEGEGDGEGEVNDGEVVVVSRRRAALRKARRLAWPFVKGTTLSLVLILAARLVLGDLLADRIDPETELLFGDDLVELYSQKVDRKEDDATMPFAVDSQWVPGRKKMKARGVQRPPQPGDEDED